ncbi:DUF6308 family protein [Geodermatophilus poikilotrophus]|uniref:Uncharacterized protein n=1 Tax=Geodermatophilus poikilotrophus TaxID=1333667 RepID=A0A1I0CSJ1_9ACTN|nr:DUF6308 family protein [Geodermatophilus poikilotrophus]SET22314.1 hypothetical protein SAMN04488546_1731 [Geodermatophilus poikilotrophus]
MTYRLPAALRDPDDSSTAVRYLRTYYGLDDGRRYTGSYFDDWQGNAEDRFTAEDLVAVSFLSVFLPPLAARELLAERADHFAQLLSAIGPDHDLVEVSDSIDGSWPVRELYTALRRLRGVGPTIASKLCARKRPRLVPVYDSIVARVTDASRRQWEPLRLELRRNDLHDRLVALRAEARVGEHVSPLRIYDVVTWMEGKDANLGPTTREGQLGAELADPLEEDVPDRDT